MNHKMRQSILNMIDNMVESYLEHPMSPSQNNCQLPRTDTIIHITNKLRDLIFPGYFSDRSVDATTLPYYAAEIVLSIEEDLVNQIRLALLRQYSNYHEKSSKYVIEEQAEDICIAFLNSFNEIRIYIEADVQAAFDGDPSAADKDIIITSYPGIFAISVYRMAHVLHKLNVPYIPRIMTEYAHNHTGIDIHPGAEIGKRFFIDHGTGVVIGETTVIGDNVKIYQGVTLGALSTRGGQNLRGAKRHPTIGDNVTIYSGASVLGEETVIDNNVVIGGNSFITESVAFHNKS